jgi:diguanylate cyclase (GGDEF)-like protein
MTPLRGIRAWLIWQAPRHVVLFVLLVEVVAIVAATGTAGLIPVHRIDLIRAGILVGCALVHIEAARATERHRELTSGAGPYLDTKAVWSVAAAIILPPVLTSAVVVATYAIAWLRIWPRRRPLHLFRWVFSAATVLLGTQAAIAVLSLGLPHFPGLPRSTAAGMIDLAVVVGAMALRWLINYGLIVAAILVSSPTTHARQVLENFDEQLQEAGAYALGMVAATLVITDPPVLAGVVLGIVALHRGLLLHQYRTASRTDTKTGLHSLDWWHHIAEAALQRAQIHGTTLAVCIADLDHFKQVNDTYGHIAGDQALKAVARTLRGEVRDYDIVGRWGGEEFALLLVDVDERSLRGIADRIRQRIHALVVDTGHDGEVISGMTISIGATLVPTEGVDTLDEALRAADTALYAVKAQGRNHVRISNLVPQQAGPPAAEIPVES